jgi:hypothetical protein
MATWEEYLHNQENVDGVRATWNMLPHSKTDAQKLVVPPAIFFAPLKVSSNLECFNLLCCFRNDQTINQSSRRVNMIRFCVRKLHARQF